MLLLNIQSFLWKVFILYGIVVVPFSVLSDLNTVFFGMGDEKLQLISKF